MEGQRIAGNDVAKERTADNWVTSEFAKAVRPDLELPMDLSEIEDAARGASVFVAVLALLTAFALYWLPTLVAGVRRHSNLIAIALVNFLLGWTGVGWVVALIWAFVYSKSDIRLVAIESQDSPVNVPAPAPEIRKPTPQQAVSAKDLQPPRGFKDHE